jgi:hypothetical protein
VPFLQTFLRTSPLSATDIVVCVAASSLVLVFAELEKVWLRARNVEARMERSRQAIA